MNLKKLPDTLDGRMDHVIEEASEVIKVMMKIRRFGWEETECDGVKYDNKADLMSELRDLRTAISRLETML